MSLLSKSNNAPIDAILCPLPPKLVPYIATLVYLGTVGCPITIIHAICNIPLRATQKRCYIIPHTSKHDAMKPLEYS